MENHERWTSRSNPEEVHMKTNWTKILATLLSLGFFCVLTQSGSSRSTQDPARDEARVRMYDGNWWLSVDSEERTGFLNGATDCLLWVAHKKWVTNSRPELDEKEITLYYKSNSLDTKQPVIDTWRKTLLKSPPPSPASDGEVWKKPHGYYNGEFWREGSESSNRGFLEGYLWCLRTCVAQPSETYSKSIDYYWTRIWDYLDAHPKTAYKEAIADILSRFRDPPAPR
jgi:hypothetical protein